MHIKISSILLILVSILFITSTSIAGMTSTNFQVKDTAIVVGGSSMNSPSYSARLVVDQPSPLDEVVICFGNNDTDNDVDGKDLAEFATTAFTQEELVKFAGVFGSTDCDN